MERPDGSPIRVDISTKHQTRTALLEWRGGVRTSTTAARRAHVFMHMPPVPPHFHGECKRKAWPCPFHR
jgi:hypothetical protein